MTRMPRLPRIGRSARLHQDDVVVGTLFIETMMDSEWLPLNWERAE